MTQTPATDSDNDSDSDNDNHTRANSMTNMRKDTL
jgi:hypothetical protein